MRIKTLESIRVYGSGFSFGPSKDFPYSMYREVDVKSKIIKWIKADMKKLLKDCHENYNKKNIHWLISTNSGNLKVWMDRFDIIIEDLK